MFRMNEYLRHANHMQPSMPIMISIYLYWNYTGASNSMKNVSCRGKYSAEDSEIVSD